jgi:hypothetical protein
VGTDLVQCPAHCPPCLYSTHHSQPVIAVLVVVVLVVLVAVGIWVINNKNKKGRDRPCPLPPHCPSHPHPHPCPPPTPHLLPVMVVIMTVVVVLMVVVGPAVGPCHCPPTSLCCGYCIFHLNCRCHGNGVSGVVVVVVVGWLGMGVIVAWFGVTRFSLSGCGYFISYKAFIFMVK